MRNLLLILMFFLIGCPAPLKVEKESTGDPDPRPWHTWEECGYTPGENPCNFTLLDQNSEEVELYDFYGKVIILDLSAMWCGVCARIAPTSETIVQDFGADNVVWITVLIEDESGLPPDQSDLQRWESDYHASGPILGGNRSLIDPAAEQGYPISGWPTVIVINQEMMIFNGVTGWSEQLVREWVGSLL